VIICLVVDRLISLAKISYPHHFDKCLNKCFQKSIMFDESHFGWIKFPPLGTNISVMYIFGHVDYISVMYSFILLSSTLVDRNLN